MFGQDFEVEAQAIFWSQSLVSILLLMLDLCQNLWYDLLTLVDRTQPSRDRYKLCPLCLWQCFHSRLGSAKANVSVAIKMFFFVFCFMLIHLSKNHKVCPKAPCRNNWWIDGIHPDYLWAASLDQKIMWMYIIILQITHNCSLRLRFTHMTISD